MTRILVVDNYDSFVFNLVQYLAQLGADVEVRRNDEIAAGDQLLHEVDGLLLSPGPGRPENAGDCVDLVRTQSDRMPVLGVCLGHQAIAVAYGGTVESAPELLHGKVSQVEHQGLGVLRDLSDPFTATRYHSLAVGSDVPEVLEVTARTPGGVVMGLRHRELPVEGVQFHPESVLTQGGYRLLANWLAECGDTDSATRVPELDARLDRQRSRVRSAAG